MVFAEKSKKPRQTPLPASFPPKVVNSRCQASVVLADGSHFVPGVSATHYAIAPFIASTGQRLLKAVFPAFSFAPVPIISS